MCAITLLCRVRYSPSQASDPDPPHHGTLSSPSAVMESSTTLEIWDPVHLSLFIHSYKLMQELDVEIFCPNQYKPLYLFVYHPHLNVQSTRHKPGEKKIPTGCPYKSFLLRQNTDSLASQLLQVL